MASVNKAIVLGNLTADPETRQTQTGSQVATFSVATNRSWKDKNGNKVDEAEYHNIVAWGKLAEICAQYLRRGKKVYIEGRLQTQGWEGQDGVKRYKTQIIAEQMVMLSRDGQPSQENHSQGGAPQYADPQQIANAGPGVEEEERIRLEDIPF